MKKYLLSLIALVACMALLPSCEEDIEKRQTTFTATMPADDLSFSRLGSIINGVPAADGFNLNAQWKEGDNYEVRQDYTLSMKKTDDSNEEISYDLQWYLVGLGLTEDAPKAYLTYYVFASDKDAKDYWSLKINQGNSYQACLYYISADSADHFKGIYCVGNMYFVIEGLEEDGVKAVKDLLTSFGYPAEKK